MAQSHHNQKLRTQLVSQGLKPKEDFSLVDHAMVHKWDKNVKESFNEMKIDPIFTIKTRRRITDDIAD